MVIRLTLFETTKLLCSLDGPSGDEGAVLSYIQTRLAPVAESITSDSMGNLLVTVKGEKRPVSRVLLAAHTDEVGFIVKRVTSDGYLRFGLVGGFDPKVLIGRRVRVGKNKARGVVALKAVHLAGPEERARVPKPSELYIDLGVSTREEAERLVRVGDSVAFDSECVEFGDGFLKAKAIDDRVGCAVLIHLAESRLAYDTTFAFTVQEEVGCVGARIAAYRAKPDLCMVVEGTTAADLHDVDGAKKACLVGGGAVTAFMDGGAIYDRELYTLLFRLAEEEKLPLQFKQLVAGGTDASVITRSNDGARVVALSVPVRYLHAAATVAKQSDMEAVYGIAEAFLRVAGGLRPEKGGITHA